MSEDDLLAVKSRGRVYFINPNSMYLPAIAEDLGYEVKLKQADVSENIQRELLEYNPNYLVIDLSFAKFRSELEFLEKVKQSMSSLTVIVTGEPFLTYNKNVTYENPFINYVIFGEAEYTLRDILEGVPDNEILGICYTDESMQSVKNEPEPFIENLDDLPLPARHLLNDNTSVTIELSRGCPCYCFFCLQTPINGKQVRARSTDSIINEIKECIKRYRTKNVYFKSCIFNYSRNAVVELCNAIINSGIKINWSCDIFPNNIDEDLVKLMKKSGLNFCKIGVETGSADVLSKLGRNVSIESIKTTVSLLKKYKIKIRSYFIIGFPADTEATVKQTIDFALELDTDEAVFNIAVPFPGTKFFGYAMMNKLFSPQTQFVDAYRKAVVKTHSLSKERLLELRDEAEKSFYGRPKYIIKTFINRLFKH